MEERVQKAKIIFFDLDCTLYKESIGLYSIATTRILEYLERMGCTKEEAVVLKNKYHADYGLVIKGLLKHHSDVDPVDYDEYVDGGLPLQEKLTNNPELRNLLVKCKYRRWIFTNAGPSHACRTLGVLGIADLFEGLVCCNYSDPHFVCKPSPEAFAHAMKQAGIPNEERESCVFIDDSFDNIKGAKTYGWTTIYINEKLQELKSRKLDQEELSNAYPPADWEKWCDFAISDILEFPAVFLK